MKTTILATTAVSLLLATQLMAQRPYQKFWEEKMKEMVPPAIVEDGGAPLDPAQERYLGSNHEGVIVSVFPGDEVSEGDPVARLALRSYVQGAYVHETTRSPQAISHFTEALKKDPQNLFLKLRVAQFSFDVNDVSRAESLYQEVLAVDDKNIHALNGLGRIMLTRSRIDDARAWFEQAHAALPGNLQALENLVQIAYQYGRDLEVTRGYAQKILSIDDTNIYGLLFNADANARLGNVEEAATFYERLIRYRPKMIAQMEETARQLEAMGRTEDAAVLFERAMLISPENDALRQAWEAAILKAGGDPALRAAYQRIVAGSRDDLRIHELYAGYLTRARDWDALLEQRRRMLEIKPSDLNSLLDLARHHSARGDFDSAEPFFQQALSTGAADAETHRVVATAYLLQNQPEKAKPLFEKAVSLNPADIESLRGLATIAANAGEYTTAEKHLRTAIDVSPANAQLIKSLGLLYREQGLNTRAADQFQAVIAADKGDFDSWLALAGIYFEEENNTALDTLEKQAAEMLRGTTRFDIGYGLLAQRFGAYERSRMALERAVSATPFDLAARRALSRVYQQIGQEELAIKVLNEIEPSVEGSPRRDEIVAAKNEALGWLYLDLKRHAEAESTFAALIELQADSLALREPYLIALIRQGKDEEVKRELNAVIRQFSPEHPVDTQLLRAQVFMEQKDAPRALGVLRQLNQEHPDHEEVAFRLAMVAGENGDIPLAEKMYRSLIEKGGPAENSYYEVSSNNLGYLLANETDRYDEAEQLVKQALAVNPSAAYILDSVGVVYLRKGELEKARQYLEKAAKLQQNDAEILTNLGQLYERIGEKDMARASYEKALSVDPKLNLPRERIEAMASPAAAEQPATP